MPSGSLATVNQQKGSSLSLGKSSSAMDALSLSKPSVSVGRVKPAIASKRRMTEDIGRTQHIERMR